MSEQLGYIVSEEVDYVIHEHQGDMAEAERTVARLTSNVESMFWTAFNERTTTATCEECGEDFIAGLLTDGKCEGCIEDPPDWECKVCERKDDGTLEMDWQAVADRVCCECRWAQVEAPN